MRTADLRTRKRLSPEQRKEQLLVCAIEVFSKRGIARAGHGDIADIGEVSVATVFNYFPTREDLVDCVLKQAEYEFKKLMTHHIRLEGGHVRSSLSLVFTALIDAALADKGWLKVWYEWSTSIRDDIWPSFVIANNAVIEKYTDLFNQGIKEGKLPDSKKAADLARFFEGACYVIYLQCHQNPDRDALINQANKYLDILTSLEHSSNSF